MDMNPWFGAPRRHRRAALKGLRRRSRRARRNPGSYRRRKRLVANPVKALMGAFEQAFSMDTLETLFHTGLGFGGTYAGSKLITTQLIPAMDTQIGRPAVALGTSIVSSGLVGMVMGPKLAARWLGGGLLAALFQTLSELIRGTTAATYIPTLGEAPGTSEFRKAIEQEVLKELRGGMSGLDPRAIYIKPSGVSYQPPAGLSKYMPAAGSSAYLTRREAAKATGMNAFMTQRELIAAQAGMGASEFDPASMTERF
jgi:MFS family permease